MSVTVVLAASTRRLTTIEALQSDLGDAGFGGDLILWQSLIDQASREAESYVGRILAQQKYTEILSMERCRLMLLRHTPIVQVHEVLFDTTAVTDYRIENAEAGLLYRRDGWYAWSETLEISVTYTAGYILPDQVTPSVSTGPEIPPDVERAVLEMVKVWHHERVPSDRVQSKTLGLTGDTISYGVSATKQAVPTLAARVLDGYRRMRLA